MLQKPPGHYKSRSSGINPGRGWELECISISSREQTNNTLQTEEFEPKNRLIQIKNSGRESILPPKNGFRHIGFKNHGRKKSRDTVTSELPTLVAYQAVQINPVLLKYQDYMTPPPSIKNAIGRNARSGNGYYLKPIARPDNDKASDIRDSSRNTKNRSHRSVRDKPEGNSMYELAMSRLNYWPALDGISEESPVNSDAKHRNMLDNDSSMEISNRSPVHNNSGVKGSKRVDSSARNITAILKKQNELKKHLEELRSHKKETTAKTDITADYYGGNPTDMSFNKEGQYKINRWELPNIHTLLGTESVLPSSRNNIDGPIKEEKKFHKDSFMKMIYKGLGKSAHSTQRDQTFENFCEEKRAAFRRKLQDLKQVKKCAISFDNLTKYI